MAFDYLSGIIHCLFVSVFRQRYNHSVDDTCYDQTVRGNGFESSSNIDDNGHLLQCWWGNYSR